MGGEHPQTAEQISPGTRSKAYSEEVKGLNQCRGMFSVEVRHRESFLWEKLVPAVLCWDTENTPVVHGEVQPQLHRFHTHIHLSCRV